MAIRSKPYIIEWPLNADQVENIDAMFAQLFVDIETNAIFPFTAVGDTLYEGTDGEPTALPIGDANTVLRSDGETPVWGQVVLTTDVSGVLPVGNGGTNGTATPTAGAVAYGTGTAYAFSAAGTSGQMLLSGGSGSPTWGEAGMTPAQVMLRVVVGI